MGLDEEMASTLISLKTENFMPDHIKVIEEMRRAIYSKEPDGTGDKVIKDFAMTQTVSPGELRRLAYFLGIRLRQEDSTDLTKRTVYLENPLTIGNIRHNVAQGRNQSPDDAEHDLLNGLGKLLAYAKANPQKDTDTPDVTP